MRKTLCCLLTWLCCSFFGIAQPRENVDSLSTERRSNQNVLLNASSDSQPRVISLGIPQWGSAIMEDGCPLQCILISFQVFGLGEAV